MHDHDTNEATRGATHAVFNQATPLTAYNAFSGDGILSPLVGAGAAAWVAPRAAELGALVGEARMQACADDANRNPPQLKTHDRFGHRIDAVEFHPAYHALMDAAFSRGVHALAWTAGVPGAFAARAVLFYLWNQLEQGTACPVTMTFASVQVLRAAPGLARDWEPKVIAEAYDARPLPLADKRAVTIGMAMTEKQGGSDLRAVQTAAVPSGEPGWDALTGHKWFCSAPMSDAFFTLARAGDAGVTCYFVPRSLPDGSRNPFLIQRLKDKVGNRSNASAEIEYRGTLARRVGEPGRGIATLIEMAHLTRFDIVVGTAGMMRAAFNQALHHTRERSAFGMRLADHALMRNVLADLALESEAATLLAFRVARAFDGAPHDAHERHVMRVLTPIAKYWHCKRLNPFVVEALECFGGNGYVEEGPMARLYREAPLNGIWEGSGNVICLDVLRAMRKAPGSVAALFGELRTAQDARINAHLDRAEAMLREPDHVEASARRVVEAVALAAQAHLMLAHAPSANAAAFVASRLGAEGGRMFGTLAAAADLQRIVERAAVA